MSEDRTSTPDDKPQRGLLERIGQALVGDVKHRDELLEQIREAQKQAVIDTDTLLMLEGALQVSEMQVRDIMIPRSQMVVVEREKSPAEYLPIIIESAHSRFPVIGENRDEVLGILLAKDLLSYFAQDDKNTFDIRDVLRPAIYVPESKRLNVLLQEFRSNRNHMAMVVDEYGGVAGLVTIEDVLEQIVGEIEDEHDFDDDVFIMEHSPDNFTIKALTPIEDFNDYFKARLSDDNNDTVGGLLLQSFGHLPKREESLIIEDFKFTVLRADSRRIHLLKVERIAQDQAADAEATEAN